MKYLNLLWPISHVAIMCPCVIIVFDDGLICGHGISGVAKREILNIWVQLTQMLIQIIHICSIYTNYTLNGKSLCKWQLKT